MRYKLELEPINRIQVIGLSEGQYAVQTTTSVTVLRTPYWQIVIDLTSLVDQVF